MASSRKIISGLKLSRIYKACSDLANTAADSEGVVDVQKLCGLLNARIILRPLLVEGMLARSDKDKEEWLVLLNSEEFPVDALNDRGHPKAARLRSTVAHELLHVLSFYGSEFGVNFSTDKPASMSREDYVERIERETDKFASLLLLGDAAIDELLDCRELADFTGFISKHAVSRYLLIQRLNHAKKLDAVKVRKSLNSRSLGLIKDGRFQPWPLFHYYENGIVPEFIHDLVDKKVVALAQLEKSSGSMFSASTRTITLPAGTPKGRHTDLLTCELSIEEDRPTRLFLLNPAASAKRDPALQLDLPVG